MLTPSQTSRAASSAAIAMIGGRTDPHALDARSGAIVEVKGERRVMTHPAGERRPRRIGVLRRDIDESRRARTGIEIFVGAADGEIGFGA